MRICFFSLTALLCFSVFSWGETYKHTLLPVPLRIRQYEVMHGYDLTNKNLLLTRKIVTKSGYIYYYFINRDTLEYGISDELQPDHYPSDFIEENASFDQIRDHPFDKKWLANPSEEEYQLLLTTDLCPVHQSVNLPFYRNLVSMREKDHLKVPLVIFLSGDWLQHHSSDWEKIKKITTNFIVGNHTYSHYIVGKRYSKKKRTYDFKEDTLRAEITMLENGILPSYFFRFPGLTYTRKELEALKKLNLVPVTVNEWGLVNWRRHRKDIRVILLVHSNNAFPTEVNGYHHFLDKSKKMFTKKKARFISIFEFFNKSSPDPDS